MFSNILGQDKALNYLKNSIVHSRIPQAYIFYGPEGVGKFTTALYYGMALNCMANIEIRPCGECPSCHKILEFSHPDLVYVFPTPAIKKNDDGEIKKQSVDEYLTYVNNRKTKPWEKYYFEGNCEIRKASIENLQKHLETSQHEGKYRICIIEDVDEMNVNTANSFLKTLEEPPANTLVIMTTSRIHSLLPTLISRCQLIFFKPLTAKVIEEILVTQMLVDKIKSKTVSHISNGNFEDAMRLVREDISSSENLMFSVLKSAIKGDDFVFYQLLTASKDQFKPELVRDMLRHLMLWFRNLSNQLHIKDMTNDYLHADNIDITLINPDIDIPKILLLIDQYNAKIDGKVNSSYIIVSLYNRLKIIFAQRDSFDSKELG